MKTMRIDPDRSLRTIRAIVTELRRTGDMRTLYELADDLGERIHELDRWITRGGRLPTDWAKPTTDITTTSGC